ncbi:hypothetical protein JQN63_30710 [Delftia lacustris]|jgi:hypothetical protein|uniref:hypothetical protein n=1 Tax=Delftia TaxID=80865 RepID=UPI000307D7E6|nr:MULTISPECIES: hypothetical protein [Delftia]MPT54625.1 hypothetical protein [Delftia sp.]MXN32410.1 hypothetical protein [Delftia sp. CH05]QRI90455.1 hypothetical protein JQN63_30710 [Delftia lacustris]SFB64624.1 hypothetical protein SAMN05444579_12018 [Delftia tsuruhatensis]
MSAQTIPLHLLKAQLELQLHLSRLLQESGQQWLEHAARNGPERIAETGSEIEGVQQTSSWQELATLPAQAFWRHAHLRMGHAQALAQTAMASQMTLAQGVQQAVHDWQQQVAATLSGGAQGAADTAVPWSDLLARWTSAVQSMAQSVTPSVTPPDHAAQQPIAAAAAETARDAAAHG